MQRTTKLVIISLLIVSSLPAFAQELWHNPAPVQLTSEGHKWGEEMLKGLSLEEG